MKESENGVPWDKVSIDNLHSARDVLLKDEMGDALTAMARRVVDSATNGRAKITVVLELKRSGDNDAVLMACDVKLTEPKVKRHVQTAWVNNNGHLVAQDQRQTNVPLAAVIKMEG